MIEFRPIRHVQLMRVQTMPCTKEWYMLKRVPHLFNLLSVFIRCFTSLVFINRTGTNFSNKHS